MKLKSLGFIIKDNHIFRLLIAFVLCLLVFGMIKPNTFFSLLNFKSMASQFPEYGILTLGIVLTMITGGIDLSLVGIANISSIFAALIMTSVPAESGKSMIAGAVIVSIVTGIICGYLNGNLVSRVGIPPILATLGMQQLLTGLSIVLTEGKAVSGLPIEYSDIFTYELFNIIPMQLILFICCFLFIGIVLSHTKYGLTLYMIGSNSTASKFSGINNVRIINQTYLLSGLMASIAGLIFLANYNSAKADYGSAYSLQCVLIAVLGGVNPSGGSGKLNGVFIAVLKLNSVARSLM